MTVPGNTYTIADDHGVEHTYVVSAVAGLKAVQLLKRIEDAASSDWLDQVLDALLAEVAGKDREQSDAEAVAVVLDQAATRLLASGDADLVAELLQYAERDGTALSRQACEKVFARNLGEMQRALRAVLEEGYGAFFARRVAPLRDWGRRAVESLLTASKRPSVRSALSGFFSGSGSSLGAVKALGTLRKAGRSTDASEP